MVGDANELHLEDFQAFVCTSCGLCCTRPWGVPVEPEVEEGIRQSKTFEQRRREGYTPIDMSDEGYYRTGRKSNGECVFLAEENLCGLHSEMGSMRKPVGCQMYPYRAVSTPSGIFVSQSFACPPVVAGLDRDIEANRTELTAVLALYPDAAAHLPDYDFPVRLTADAHISWSSYLLLEHRLVEAFDPDRPIDSLIGMALSLITLSKTQPLGKVEEWPKLSGIPEDLEFERELLVMYLAAVISIVETEHDMAGRSDFRQGLLDGQMMESKYIGFTLPRLDIDLPQQPLLREAFHRWFRNGVVGKTLLSPSVVGRLLAMAVGHAMLLFYGEAFRLKRGESTLGLEALTLAFEVVEGDAISHSDALDRFFVDYEAMLVKLQSPLPWAWNSPRPRGVSLE